MAVTSFFVVERYIVARAIWKMRNERAHEGFPATEKRAAIPAQTYGEWFEWAYGMSLDEYSKVAKERDHASVVTKLSNVMLEYKIGPTWFTCIAAPGETYEEASAAIQRIFPQIEAVRPRA